MMRKEELTMAVISLLIEKICLLTFCHTNTSILLPLRNTLICPFCPSKIPIHLNEKVTSCPPKLASNLKSN